MSIATEKMTRVYKHTLKDSDVKVLSPILDYDDTKTRFPKCAGSTVGGVCATFEKNEGKPGTTSKYCKNWLGASSFPAHKILCHSLESALERGNATDGEDEFIEFVKQSARSQAIEDAKNEPIKLSLKNMVRRGNRALLDSDRKTVNWIVRKVAYLRNPNYPDYEKVWKGLKTAFDPGCEIVNDLGTRISSAEWLDIVEKRGKITALLSVAERIFDKEIS